MFDGTDLSLAYSSMYEAEPMQQPSIAPKPVHQQPALEMPKATASHAQPPELPYNPPVAMFAQQSAQAEPVNSIMRQESTFWERLADKKVDVLKLVVLSLVVLLAIASDRMVSHYLTGYISKAFLSEMQEMLVRLAYPIGIILLLWIIKAA